jgi:hypothetical protein
MLRRRSTGRGAPSDGSAAALGPRTGTSAQQCDCWSWRDTPNVGPCGGGSPQPSARNRRPVLWVIPGAARGVDPVHVSSRRGGFSAIGALFDCTSR